MRVIFKSEALVLLPETEVERDAFSTWRQSIEGHVFFFDGGSDKGGALLDLGARAEACREPINIVFDQGDSRWQPISNLALAPFNLMGRYYASVEGFWQGLKFLKEADRMRVAALWGKEAKRAGDGLGEVDEFVYEGATCAVGGHGHRSLMLEACRAKFNQNAEARQALLATGNRPLMHRVRRDSKTIPGVVMAEIWMRIRDGLHRSQVE
jgi:predicted NAD-dependent protein-ADP-ribosyltransferase YbiA (DUF1768 family)